MKYGRIIKGSSPEEKAFTSIADFQTSMRRNAKVAFIYNDVTYTLHEEGITSISEAYKPETEALCDNSDDLLDHVIEGKKLREIITEVTVTDRAI